MKLILCTLAALIFVGCAPLNSNQNDQSSEEGRRKQDPAFRPAKICYSSAPNATKCYATVERAKLSSQKELYGYPNPYTSPNFPPSFSKAQYVPPDRLLDFRLIPATQLVSPHFERFELMPENARRGYYGVFSTTVLSRLEQLRTNIGRPIVITSGYRSPGHNQNTDGAAEWSRHTYGDGIDFKVSGIGYRTLAQHCTKVGAGFYQVYTDHIHCDWRNLSGDRAYYPDAVDMNPAASVLTIKEIEAAGNIQLRANIKETGTPSLVLEATVPQEDTGELIYEWEVTDETGLVWTSEERLFELPYTNHAYDVRVRVGGSAVLNRKINLR